MEDVIALVSILALAIMLVDASSIFMAKDGFPILLVTTQIKVKVQFG